MFEIGNSLREARLRQGIDLSRAEHETKVRGKYLQALEEERFELLPADTYVKGFLRTYAEYLGLDGQLYVDEYNSRFSRVEEPLVANRGARRRRERSAESNFVVVALAGIVAVTVLVVVAWQFGSGDGANPDSPPAAPPAAASEPPPGTSAAEGPSPPSTEAAAAAGEATYVLNAIRGGTVILVRAGGGAGELLFEGTLERGDTQRFVRKKLWVQFGDGRFLEVKIDGRKVDGVPNGPGVVVLTPRGARFVTEP